MRVTERSRIESLSLAQNRAASRLDKATRIAADGTNVSKPSDDPAAYGAKVRRNYDMAMLETRSQTASRTQGELEIANNALSAGVDIMERAQEAAVEGANATASPETRKLLAQDIRAMRAELMSVGNTKYGDRYIFSGTKSDTIPFSTNGAFNGNDQTVSVPVLDGVNLPANVSGAKAFTAVGGRDIFADLDALANSLDANDQDRVRAQIVNLTSGHDQLVRTQVEAGYGARRFADAVDVLANTHGVVAERESKEIQGDPAKQITELQLARTAYERSIAVTKQILNLNTNG